MRGLLTIEPLYHKSVAGLKTQTRRSGGLRVINCKPDLWHLMEFNGEVATFLFNYSKQRNHNHLIKEVCKPRYKIGEVLYLKEPVSINIDPAKSFYYYDLSPDHDYRDRKKFRWPNKMFMSAKAARAFIRITGIKCERLLDIKGMDCIAEGCEGNDYMAKSYDKDKENAWFTTDSMWKDSFISLFKFANKMNPAAEVPNIWVWAYTYEYLKDYKYGN